MDSNLSVFSTISSCKSIIMKWSVSLIAIVCIAAVNGCPRLCQQANSDKNVCFNLGEEREINCNFPTSAEKLNKSVYFKLTITGLPCDEGNNSPIVFTVVGGNGFDYDALSSSGNKGIEVDTKPGCKTNFATNVHLLNNSSNLKITTKFNITAEIDRPIEFECYSHKPNMMCDTCSQRIIIPEPREIDALIVTSKDENFSVANISWKEPNGTDSDNSSPQQYTVILDNSVTGEHTEVMTQDTQMLLPLAIHEGDNNYTVCIKADYIDGISCPVCKPFRLVRPGSIHLPAPTVMDFTIKTLSRLVLKLKLPFDLLPQAETMCFDVERNYDIERICLNMTDLISDTVNITVSVPRNDCSIIHVYSIRVRAVSISAANQAWTTMPGNWSKPICAMLNPPEIQIPKFSVNGSIVEFTVRSPMIALAAGLCKCSSIKANFVMVNITDADDPDNVVLADEDNGGSMRHIEMEKSEISQRLQLRDSSKETRLRISAKASYNDLDIPGNNPTVIFITCPATCSRSPTDPSPSPSNIPSPTEDPTSNASSQYRNGSKILIFILILLFVVFTKLLTSG